MMWLNERLQERTSQAAIAAAVAQIATIASQPNAWTQAGWPQWLTLVQPLSVCVLAFLVPEGSSDLLLRRTKAAGRSE